MSMTKDDWIKVFASCGGLISGFLFAMTVWDTVDPPALQGPAVAISAPLPAGDLPG